MDESADLLGSNHPGPSKCKICCLMCSCCNKKGIWYTKFGKFLFWLPFFVIFGLIGFGILVLFGIGTMKIVYSQFDVSNGCLYIDRNCTVPTMCRLNNMKALTVGCAAVGSISVAILFISTLVIMVIIGCMFHCFDTCSNELDKSYRHSKFTLERQMQQSSDVNL
jgi:hypothetical protein